MEMSMSMTAIREFCKMFVETDQAPKTRIVGSLHSSDARSCHLDLLVCFRTLVGEDLHSL